MVRKRFWENPYATSLDTAIDAVEGNLVFLRETIFYALSGGQESDREQKFQTLWQPGGPARRGALPAGYLVPRPRMCKAVQGSRTSPRLGAR